MPIRAALGTLFILSALCIQGCSGDRPLEPWHTEALTEEFTADMADGQVRTFEDYLALEQRLFKQLDDTIYANTPAGPGHELNRFSRGSTADPERWERNWNHSFELDAEAPVGGVLPLHGMSDSPCSLRALAEAINDRGFQVVGLRLPGHGTASSGLRSISWQDMAAAVRLAMAHLAARLGSMPIHINVVSLRLAWPRGAVSLSHVALAFPPDDPLYGQGPPATDDLVFLGNLAITGERGLVSIPADWLLRQRYNPFYPYLQTRVLKWLDASGVEATSSSPGET